MIRSTPEKSDRSGTVLLEKGLTEHSPIGTEAFLDPEVEPDGNKKISVSAPDPHPILTSRPLTELSESHRSLIEGSAILPEIVRKRGYRTVTDHKILIHLGFAPHQRVTPTLLIPVWSVDGRIDNVQSRPDIPRVDKVKKKTVKYETPSRSRMLLDIHPRSRPHIGNPSIPLWITEGIRKADSLLSAGAGCVIGLLGVWNWRGSNKDGGSMVLPDWESIALKNREIFLAFDFDPSSKTRKNVRNALGRLTAFLRTRGGDVKIVQLPEGKDGAKNGIDDYLGAGHNLVDLLGLVEQEKDEDPEESRHSIDGIPHGFRLDRRGVFYLEEKKDENGIPQIKETWIAGPILVEALARNEHGHEWGRVLVFEDPDGRVKKWVMPVEMLKGSGEEVRGILLNMGANISPIPRIRPLINQYLQSCRPKDRVRCVSKIGWSKGQFAFPDKSIGKAEGEGVLFQSEQGPIDHEFGQSGTQEEWKHEVSSLCSGNSRLIFAASVAFAGPLLELAGMDSGGFHLFGPSSSGKTTALRVAASVYGPPEYIRQWRTTDNGLEGLLTRRNDCAVILDEIGQVDSRIIGPVAYLIANGHSKGRAGRSGGLRPHLTWRTILLSSGEIDFSSHLGESGFRPKAGQMVRIIDIPAETEPGSIFESTCGEGGPTFSDRLKEASSRYYGTAIRSFLEKLITCRESMMELLRKGRADFARNHLPDGAEGQVARVADRFALVAIAGEIATLFEITGWRPGEGEQAAAICFKAWLDRRGGSGNQERDMILRQVRSFFEAHGSSRFEPWDADEGMRIVNRVGFRREEAGETTFYVFPESFRNEVLTGLDLKTAVRVLVEAGWLKPDNKGKSSQSVTLPNLGKKRVYVFHSDVFEEPEKEEQGR